MKKRILVLSFRLPLPLTEGFKIRTYNIARMLAQEYQVDLLALDSEHVSKEYLAQLRELFGQVVVYPIHPILAKLRAVSALPARLPLQVAYHHSRRAQNWINKHYDNYDLLFCVHVRMAQYLKGIPGKKVIDLIDTTSLLYRGALCYATGLWKGIYCLESRRLLTYELKAVNLFDKAFISSKYDAASLACGQSTSLNDRLVVIPNGVREELLNQASGDEGMREEDWLLFLGKMDYAPNVDAVIHFCNHIWPAIRSSHSELKFIIAGTSPRPEVKALAQIPGVEVTGFLADPFSYVQRAKLIVIPLRYAAGIQNKVLEAMALGKPVVTTPVAVRGIEGISDDNCRVVQERELTAEITALLKNKPTRDRLGNNARQLVRSRYRWHLVGKRLLQEIEHIMPEG